MIDRLVRHFVFKNESFLKSQQKKYYIFWTFSLHIQTEIKKKKMYLKEDSLHSKSWHFIKHIERSNK